MVSDFRAEELVERIGKLKNLLVEKGVDLAIVTQNSDLYYYTGSIQPQYLLVPVSGEPVILARKQVISSHWLLTVRVLLLGQVLPKE